MGELQVVDERSVLGKEFKMYGDFNNPLFLAKDVAEWIEHSNPTEMLRTVDDSEKLNSTILSAGQNREMTFLTEDGLYEVLMQSRKPIAKEFKKEVKEILKSVRKHGGYMAGQEQMTPEQMLLASMNWLQSKVAEQQEQITAMQPKAVFYDIAMEAENTFSMDEVAKLLKLPYGRNVLFKTLRDLKILNQNNVPYQDYINAGYFKIVEKPVFIGKKTEIKIVTRATQKGLAYISRKIS